MTVYGHDNFIRSDQAGWGNASDGQIWTPTGPGALSIVNNEGILVSTGVDTHVQLGSQIIENMEERCLIAISVSNDICGIQARFTAASGTTTYKLVWFTGTININKSVTGTITNLASTGFVMTPGVLYWFQIRLVNTTIQGRIWEAGTPEPNTWMLSAEDTSVTGNGGFAVLAHTDALSTGVRFASFTALDPVWTIPSTISSSLFSQVEARLTEIVAAIAQIVASDLSSFAATGPLSAHLLMKQDGLLVTLLLGVALLSSVKQSSWSSQALPQSIGAFFTWLIVQESMTDTSVVTSTTLPTEELIGRSTLFQQVSSSLEASQEIRAELAAMGETLLTSPLLPQTLGTLQRWLCVQESITTSLGEGAVLSLLEVLAGTALLESSSDSRKEATGSLSSSKSMSREYQPVSLLAPLMLMRKVLISEYSVSLLAIEIIQWDQLITRLEHHGVIARMRATYGFESINQESISSFQEEISQYSPVNQLLPVVLKEWLFSWSRINANTVQDLFLGSLVAAIRVPETPVQIALAWMVVCLRRNELSLSREVQYSQSLFVIRLLPLSDLFVQSGVLEHLSSLPILEEILYHRDLERREALSIQEQMHVSVSLVGVEGLLLEDFSEVKGEAIPLSSLLAQVLSVFERQALLNEFSLLSFEWMPAQVLTTVVNVLLSEEIFFEQRGALLSISPVLARLLAQIQEESLYLLAGTTQTQMTASAIPVLLLPLLEHMFFLHAYRSQTPNAAVSRLASMDRVLWMNGLAALVLLVLVGSPFTGIPPLVVVLRGRDGLLETYGRDGFLLIRGRSETLEGRGR